VIIVTRAGHIGASTAETLIGTLRLA
jgi:hypothetical protein